MYITIMIIIKFVFWLQTAILVFSWFFCYHDNDLPWLYLYYILCDRIAYCNYHSFWTFKNLKFLLSYTIFVLVQSVYISYLYIDNLRYAMHFLHRSESTDSLLAWSPLECERNKYAQRYFLSTTSKQRKLQPTLLDRTVLDRTFRRLEGNQSTDCEKEPAETTSGYRAKNARRKSAIKASIFCASSACVYMI